MSKLQNLPSNLKFWLSKSWVQWALAFVLFFLIAWLYMGNSITTCSNNTAALESDSTGGFAWIQWAGGNGLSWGHTNVANYPLGEALGTPQYITSTVFIAFYKVFSALSTPICGLNLMTLLGYMSSALVMYGLVRWLLKRNDIALFAGYAAGFVPFHQQNATSHINYVFSSPFIAIIWAYLWFISKPTLKKALLLSVISSIGFYFDGYYVLITAVVVGGLFLSSFVLDFIRGLFAKDKRRDIKQKAFLRAKYLLASVLLLAVLLVPILVTYVKSGSEIDQSLATVRSSIKGETETYGLRPIEFLLPSNNNALLSGTNYEKWRATKLHNSNFSESTLYIGYTVIVLAIVSMCYLFYRKHRLVKFRGIAYTDLMFTIAFTFLACFGLSLPAVVTIFGHNVDTPVDILVKMTGDWRVLSRFFLAIDPLVVILASLGLYMITKSRPKYVRLAIVAVCGLLLFLEYLPSPLHTTSNLYKNAPPIYKQLAKDPSVKLVAEYPLASFVYTPEIFTFQPVYNKPLLNSNNGDISEGPFDSSIAGLDDAQTLGVLKRLNVSVIITHGFTANNPNLTTYYVTQPVRRADGKINIPASLYSYKISNAVTPRDSVLVIKNGAQSLSVDAGQISHRYITGEATMGVASVDFSRLAQKYTVGFDLNSVCPVNAHVTISQSGQIIWSGSVNTAPNPVALTVSNKSFDIKTIDCSIGVTNMSSEAIGP
ncbi:MAG TPA: hypothetical protein VMR28_02430 [Candidatus Saccharimonadales bacterium]|nr:hypothetical protein [Candidatus Saccharimonadales bacterium]